MNLNDTQTASVNRNDIIKLATGIQKTLVKVSHNDIITQIYDIIFNHNDTQTRQ